VTQDVEQLQVRIGVDAVGDTVDDERNDWHEYLTRRFGRFGGSRVLGFSGSRPDPCPRDR
jgi:hypothetical protein